MNNIKHILFFLLSFMIVVLLPACGSKGDLYQVLEPQAAQNSQVKDSENMTEETEKKQP